MSWEIINQILGWAATDREFAQALLEDPIAAIQARGFVLTEGEEKVLTSISAGNLQQLSQILLKKIPRQQNNAI